MLSASDLSAILNSAMRQHAQTASDPASLIPFVIREILDRVGVDSAALWQVDDSSHARLLWEQSAAAWAQSINPASILAVKVGSVAHAHSTEDGKSSPDSFVFSAALLNERMRLVIGFRDPNRLLTEADSLQLADLIADIRRREMLGTLSENLKRNAELIAFISAIQETTDREELLHRFATDAAVVTGADRIAILSRTTSGSWQIVACTGVDNVAARADEVQRICKLVRETEQNGAESVTVIPLSVSHNWRDAELACVVECASEDGLTDPQIVRLVTNQLTAALALQRVRNRKRGFGSIRRRTMFAIIAVMIFGGLSVLLMMPTTFQVRADGEAQPVLRQYVFAPDHGVISDVFVEHGSLVTAGTLICTIYSDELEVHRETTREELTSTQARLAALKTIAFRPTTVNSRELPLSVEQAELEKKTESLESQMALIDKQIETLSIVAPFDGQVIHERMREELLGRPVQQGQYLFQMIDPHGAWELALRIPEREMRHVLEAQSQSAAAIPVSFVMETSPTIEHQTNLKKIAIVTDVDQIGSLSTLAHAELDQTDVQDVRLGAGVLAKINCGQKTWLYILTRGLTEFWARHSPF